METLDVKLLLPHTHESKEYQIDDVLNVDKQTANWLISRQIAQLITEKTEAKK